MKLPYFLLILIVVASVCAGQSQAFPKKTYQVLGSMSCDAMDGVADRLAQDIIGADDMRGLIVIKPDQDNPETAVRLMGELQRAIALRRFGKNAPAVTFTNSDGQQTTAALYLLSERSPLPNVPLFDQPVLKNLQREFFYGSDFSEACWTNGIDERFAKFLVLNPSLRGQIVVVDDSRVRRRQTANRWFRLFTKTAKIERSRIRIRFRREDHFSGWSTHYTTFSVLP